MKLSTNRTLFPTLCNKPELPQRAAANHSCKGICSFHIKLNFVNHHQRCQHDRLTTMFFCCSDWLTVPEEGPAFWGLSQTCTRLQVFVIKFIYSEKATKIFEIFPLLLTVCTVDKSKGKISQHFVAFSEYIGYFDVLSFDNFFCIIKNQVAAF